MDPNFWLITLALVTTSVAAPFGVRNRAGGNRKVYIRALGRTRLMVGLVFSLIYGAVLFAPFVYTPKWGIGFRPENLIDWLPVVPGLLLGWMFWGLLIVLVLSPLWLSIFSATSYLLLRRMK